MPYSESLKKSIIVANRHVLRSKEQFAVSTKILNLIHEQNIIYQHFKLDEYSLYNQILNFLKVFQTRSSAQTINGICFFDFDNTLFDFSGYSQLFNMYRSVWEMKCEEAKKSGKEAPPFPPITADLRTYYNAVSRQRWHQVLNSIKTKNYLVVLLTNRSRITDEDAPVEQLLYQDMRHYFDSYLFTGYLDNKGEIIEHLHSLIVEKFSIQIPKEKCILIDDSISYIANAQALGFRTITAFPQKPLTLVRTSPFPSPLQTPFNTFTRMQTPKEPDFIRELLELDNLEDSSVSVSMGSTTSTASSQLSSVPLFSIISASQTVPTAPASAASQTTSTVSSCSPRIAQLAAEFQFID